MAAAVWTAVCYAALAALAAASSSSAAGFAPPMNSSSRCARAFAPPAAAALTARQERFRPLLAVAARPAPLLSVVNVGSGTTGTSLVFHVFCAGYRWKSTHWSMSCNADNDRANWFKFIDNCIQQQSRTVECSSARTLEVIEENLVWAVDHMHTLSDYPYSNFLPELLALAPNVTVLQTVRDPVEWSKSRVAKHNPKICREELHALPSVRHPFDLVGCLRHRTYVHEALVTRKVLQRELRGNVTRLRMAFEDAFVKLNTYNTEVAAATARRRATNVCLFDKANQVESTKDLIGVLHHVVRDADCVRSGRCTLANDSRADVYRNSFCADSAKAHVAKLKLPAAISSGACGP